MNKSPFYSIRLKDSQEDITDNIDGFRYEESVSKDDLLRLSVTSKKAQELIQQGFLTIGQELVFSFGYIGGRQSGKRLARITGRDRVYGQQVNYQIIATDLGLLMKKAQRFDDWSGSTSSQIARRIAQRNGFQITAENTRNVHSVLPQGGKTDFELLKYLASIEGGGFRFYMSGDTVYFTKRNLLQESSATYDYTDKSAWIRLSIQERDNTKDGGSRKTEVRSTNPITGEPVTTTATAEENKEGALGRITVHINERGEEQFVRPSVASKADKGRNVSRVIPGGEHYEKSATKGASDSYQRDAALSDLEAELQIAGNPLQRVDTVVTLEGLPDEDAGNWYADSVSHAISQGAAYKTTLALMRNASNIRKTDGGNTERDQSKINKSVGPRAQEQKKELVIVDGNGNIIE